MIAVDIIGCHCCIRLDLVGLGIREAQDESVANGIGLIPNGLGPYKGHMTTPTIPLSSFTPTFVLSSPPSCPLILLPIGGFVVIIILIGFPVKYLLSPSTVTGHISDIVFCVQHYYYIRVYLRKPSSQV